jgi:hypothetical protein
MAEVPEPNDLIKQDTISFRGQEGRRKIGSNTRTVVPAKEPRLDIPGYALKPCRLEANCNFVDGD